jgi:hypothetical protein
MESKNVGRVLNLAGVATGHACGVSFYHPVDSMPNGRIQTIFECAAPDSGVHGSATGSIEADVFERLVDLFQSLLAEIGNA